MKSGGYNEFDRLNDPRNKKGVNEVFFQMGSGKILKEKLKEYKKLSLTILNKYMDANKYLDFYPMIDLECEKKGKDWVDFVFKEMPIGAIEPIMLKFKNDILLNRVYILKKLNETSSR